MQIDRFDLREYVQKVSVLRALLETYDVVWFGGGNTYYLRWLMRESGFDTIVGEVLQSGVVYGGGSAGAVVAGKDIRYYDTVDDPICSPEVIFSGLRLTNVAIIPHWGTESIKKELENIKRSFLSVGVTAVTLTDEQSIIINNDEIEVVP